MKRLLVLTAGIEQTIEEVESDPSAEHIGIDKNILLASKAIRFQADYQEFENWKRTSASLGNFYAGAPGTGPVTIGMLPAFGVDPLVKDISANCRLK